jgi:hypothetical protein
MTTFKKNLFLISLLFTLFIAGCNEKNLLNQIDGTWHLQKYAIDGADKTYSYDTSHANFTWTFAGTSFNQSWLTLRNFQLYTRDTIAHYDTMMHAFVIDSITISIAQVPSGYTVKVSGDWYLTNGNQFLETRDSVYGQQLYQIIDHSKNSLHLLRNNEDFYLSK